MILARVCGIVLTLALVGCATTQDTRFSQKSPPGQKRITNVYWVINNVDRGHFSGFDQLLSCSISIEIEFSEEVQNGEIVGAGYNIPGIYSRALDIENNVDHERRLVGGRWSYYYILDPPHSGNAHPIGKTSFWIRTSANDLLTADVEITPPGRLTSDGSNFVVTEDATAEEVQQMKSTAYFGSKVQRLVSALRRPKVTTWKRDGSVLFCSFVEKDSRFYDGRIVFYDSEGSYVGSSDSFRDGKSRKVGEIINGGAELRTDGSENHVQINLEAIKYFGSRTIDDIASFDLVITDGAAYPAGRSGFDYRSYGDRVHL